MGAVVRQGLLEQGGELRLADAQAVFVLQQAGDGIRQVGRRQGVRFGELQGVVLVVRQGAEELAVEGKGFGGFLSQFAEGGALVVKEPQAGFAVCQRRIFARADDFVVLEQAVIGVLRECQRREAQGVNDGQVMQRRGGRVLVQHGQVVREDVVPHQVLHVCGEGFQRGDGGGAGGVVVQAGAFVTRAVVAAQRANLQQCAAVAVGFEVEDEDGERGCVAHGGQIFSSLA